ncbi:MAG TPA: M64 family metallopeptidase [Pyrinomonadaceae bacterium]|jgi:hypothetical protein
MSASDGTVVGTTQIVNNGSAAERFNLVLVAEGYRQSELSQFAAHAQQFVDRLFSTPPFDELQCSFNVFRVDVASNESGADDPAACGGTGASVATYFDASFCNGGIQRLLLVDGMSVINVVNAQIPQWHQVLVIVNSPTWGGAGGQIGTTSVAGGWENIAIHEMGHSAYGLADEYEYWSGCGVDTTQNSYTGAEPAQPNITADSNRATIKWGSLVAASTPMPTTTNADCSFCDPQPNPLPTGTTGAFEGAGYFHCGCFRPEFDCMMRNLSPFCAVCRQRIRQVMSPYMPSGGCPAPVFPGSNFIECFFRTIVNLLLILVLVLLAWIPSIRCLIKQLWFRVTHCRSGNTNRCIRL